MSFKEIFFKGFVYVFVRKKERNKKKEKTSCIVCIVIRLACGTLLNKYYCSLNQQRIFLLNTTFWLWKPFSNFSHLSRLHFIWLLISYQLFQCQPNLSFLANIYTCSLSLSLALSLYSSVYGLMMNEYFSLNSKSKKNIIKCLKLK